MALAHFLSNSARAGGPASSAALDVGDLVDGIAAPGLPEEWNALVDASGGEPFYRHEYARSWMDHFAPNAPLRVLTGRDVRGRLVAALPLMAKREAVYGVPTRQLVSPTNVHSFRFDLIAGEGDEERAGQDFFDHLAADRSWDVIKITDVPENGKAWRLHAAAREAGFPVGAWLSQKSPYIRLPSSPDELLRGLDSKFKANLRRRRKRLREQGRVSFERISGSALSEAHFEECLDIERSGWKGRGGTAMAQDDKAHGFQVQLLRTPRYRDHLSLSVLKLDGKAIAFDYGLTCGGVYSLVMTSYHEGFKEFSPGHLLLEEVLKDCISRKLSEFDFLGCDLPWKLDWTRTVRPHHWLFIFRNSARGRALCKAKFDWIPAARQTIEEWRRHFRGERA